MRNYEITFYWFGGRQGERTRGILRQFSVGEFETQDEHLNSFFGIKGGLSVIIFEILVN